MSKKNNYTDLILEEMRSDIKAVLEIVVPMRAELSEVKILASEIPEIKADIQTIEHALRATNTQVADHDQRIARLETKPAT